ncbi:MAG: hypothetical protein R3F29_13145 [Planctomycetota bacterium]
MSTSAERLPLSDRACAVRVILVAAVALAAGSLVAQSQPGDGRPKFQLLR